MTVRKPPVEVVVKQCIADPNSPRFAARDTVDKQWREWAR